MSYEYEYKVERITVFRNFKKAKTIEEVANYWGMRGWCLKFVDGTLLTFERKTKETKI